MKRIPGRAFAWRNLLQNLLATSFRDIGNHWQHTWVNISTVSIYRLFPAYKHHVIDVRVIRRLKVDAQNLAISVQKLLLDRSPKTSKGTVVDATVSIRGHALINRSYSDSKWRCYKQWSLVYFTTRGSTVSPRSKAQPVSYCSMCSNSVPVSVLLTSAQFAMWCSRPCRWICTCLLCSSRGGTPRKSCNRSTTCDHADISLTSAADVLVSYLCKKWFLCIPEERVDIVSREGVLTSHQGLSKDAVVAFRFSIRFSVQRSSGDTVGVFKRKRPTASSFWVVHKASRKH